jgi:hypothetical protein
MTCSLVLPLIVPVDGSVVWLPAFVLGVHVLNAPRRRSAARAGRRGYREPCRDAIDGRHGVPSRTR